MKHRKIPNEKLGRLSENEFSIKKKNPIIIVLDNIRSMQNVGSVFRTADAFLLEKIHLCGISATPPHRDIMKTALGATETVQWQYFSETSDSIKYLQDNNYKIYSIEQADNSISLENFHWQNNQKTAFIFGHEVKGVQQSVINESDGVIEIPQWGTKHSFNISVSVGIVLWQVIGKNKSIS